MWVDGQPLVVLYFYCNVLAVDSPWRFGNDSLSVSYTCCAGVRLSTAPPVAISDRNPRSAATIYKCVMSVSI